MKHKRKKSFINTLATQHLELLKKSLLGELYLENEARILFLVAKLLENPPPPLEFLVDEFVNIDNTELYSVLSAARKTGGWIKYFYIDEINGHAELTTYRNFNFTAHTMIGRARLDNIHACLDIITHDKIPGDLIETGVWKGGATVFMRGYLAAHDIPKRKVWVADSFQGLPPPTHEKDGGHDYSQNNFPYLSVDKKQVKELFERYGLMDSRVRFLKGWFRDTLPTAPIKKLALLRLDGDLYESTMDALVSLYHKLSPGGFVIVDDYFTFPQCAEAIHDFLNSINAENIEFVRIDDQAVYWRKPMQ